MSIQINRTYKRYYDIEYWNFLSPKDSFFELDKKVQELVFKKKISPLILETDISQIKSFAKKLYAYNIKINKSRLDIQRTHLQDYIAMYLGVFVQSKDISTIQKLMITGNYWDILTKKKIITYKKDPNLITDLHSILNAKNRCSMLQKFWMKYFNTKISYDILKHFEKALYPNGSQRNLNTIHHNMIFSYYLNYLQINSDTLSEEDLDKKWSEIFNSELSQNTSKKKHTFFTLKYDFEIEYVSCLPTVNTTQSCFLIVRIKSSLLMKHWKTFTSLLSDNDILSRKGTCKKRFLKFNIPASIEGLIHSLNSYDESIQSEYCKKQITILFILYLTGEKLMLLPPTFVFLNDPFFSNTMNLKSLKSLRGKHFFVSKPNNKHLIEEELNKNTNTKEIFYLRFSYLVNSDQNMIINIDDNVFKTIKDNLLEIRKDKSVSTMENPLRRCLYWHGATMLSQSNSESKKSNLSPLQILSLSCLGKKIESLKNIFIPFFSSKPDNQDNRKLALHIAKLITYLKFALPTIDKDTLHSFFELRLEETENNKPQSTSSFLKYMESQKLSPSIKKDLQIAMSASIEASKKFSGSFPSIYHVELYKMPKNRNIARLSLDRSIREEMKRICLFDPPKDFYYVLSNINKNNSLWKFYDYTEPQLPVMLFLHLCLPWRSEHIKSLDRDSFLQKNEKGETIGIQVTTDKNQNKDFYIEKEFFDYAFNFKVSNNNVDVYGLLEETIEHTKLSFPHLEAEYRKDNKNWGLIKPILCSNKAKGFISHEAYAGYYYKVLLKALYSLGYSKDKISYFVQLSLEGIKKLGDLPDSFYTIENYSCSKVNSLFNSEYFSPHALRKTNITHFVDDKRSMEFILKLSGHSALSTVLRVYIDYNFLATLGFTDDMITSIENNFRTDNSNLYSKEIIENYKKYQLIDIQEILGAIKEDKLFFSILTIDKNRKSIKKNDIEINQILAPIFWHQKATGICTFGSNCPAHINNQCSLCPYFLTGPKFFAAINSIIMQLTTRVVELFKIIDRHDIEENLDGQEVIFYEEEVQRYLAELQGYMAITREFNNSLYNIIMERSTDKQKKNLPARNDFDLIYAKHVPYLGAQLEIYKAAKQNSDFNPSIQHAISELYKKITELIILGEINISHFTEIDLLSDHEKTIDVFLNIIEDYSPTEKLENTARQFLLEI